MRTEHWSRSTVGKSLVPVRPAKPSIPKTEYQREGRFPIIDQGRAPIAGYTDLESSVYFEPLPLIVFGDHTRVFKYVDGPFATGADGTKLLRPDPERFDPEFFYFALRSLDLPSRGYNRHFRFLRDKSVLHPIRIDSQVAIARDLRTLAGGIDLTERRIALATELKAATMAKLFREGLRGEPLKQTEIGEIPESWEIELVGDLFDIQLGKMLSPKARRGIAPFPYLRNIDVQWGRINTKNLPRMDFNKREREKFRLLPADILVCEGGEPGRTALWEGAVPNCYYQKALHRLRPRSDMVVPLYYVFWSEAAFRHLGTHDYTSSKTTIAHLPAVKLSAMPMPVPSLDEQEEIIRIVSEIDTALRNCSMRYELLVELFEAAMSHCFERGGNPA